MALGGDLLSHLLQAVPSARSVLTSLFGMGRGVPRRYSHRNLFPPGLRRMGLTDVSEEDSGNRKSCSRAHGGRRGRVNEQVPGY